MALPYEAVTLTAKQSNIFQWGWQPEARHRVAVCGRRFGKTFLARREIKRAVQLAAKRSIPIQNEIWYGAPTFKQAKRVFWRLMKSSIPKHWIDGKPNESECTITMVTGHVVRIVGLDNYEDLRGSGLFFFLGDEWADCQPECWTQVIFPMLGTAGGHSLKIGTPKGFNHFHDDYQKGQLNGEPGHKSFSYTTIEGGNYPPEDIAAAERTLDKREFEQEYNATFASYAGQVLYAFSRKNNVKPCPYDPKKPIHVGMDFNVNPMSATIWQEDGELSYQVGELIIPTSDTDEMSKDLIRKYGRISAQGKTVDGVTYAVSHISVYPDPAGAQSRTSAQGKTDISILRSYGFDVLQMNSHPLVRDRLVTTNSRFTNASGEHRAFVDPSCKKSIEAYERHEYKDDTNVPDKTHGYDHPVDATGYYMYVRFGTSKLRQIKIIGF